MRSSQEEKSERKEVFREKYWQKIFYILLKESITYQRPKNAIMDQLSWMIAKVKSEIDLKMMPI